MVAADGPLRHTELHELDGAVGVFAAQIAIDLSLGAEVPTAAPQEVHAQRQRVDRSVSRGTEPVSDDGVEALFKDVWRNVEPRVVVTHHILVRLDKEFFLASVMSQYRTLSNAHCTGNIFKFCLRVTRLRKCSTCGLQNSDAGGLPLGGDRFLRQTTCVVVRVIDGHASSFPLHIPNARFPVHGRYPDQVGQVLEAIDGRLRDFIEAQHLYFVGTAPNSTDGHINLSPKGHGDTFTVIDETTVAYLDLTGSGAESLAHLRENGRIVIMFCALDGPPNIVRLHGRGEIVTSADSRWADLLKRFHAAPRGPRHRHRPGQPHQFFLRAGSAALRVRERSRSALPVGGAQVRFRPRRVSPHSEHHQHRRAPGVSRPAVVPAVAGRPVDPKALVLRATVCYQRVMTIEVRPLLDDAPDADAAFELLVKVDVASFAEDAEMDELKTERGVSELDRAILAWDGDEPVGCASIYSMQMSVPGGTVPCAGVTWVGVLPTHRRRGVMTAMLDHMHSSIRAAGNEPLAGLWASQPPIYPRFGYGLASRHLWVTIQRAHGSISTAPIDPNLRTRLVAPADDAPFTMPVYAQLMQVRPAMTALTDSWQARLVDDPKSEREGASSLRTVLVEDDNAVRGYARYAFKHEWKDGFGDGIVRVNKLMATDPAAEAALWRYLIDFELSGQVDVWNLPVDSPISHWLDQPRHHKRQVGDALYLKFMDLPTAFATRTFSEPLDFVADVTDESSPWNAGRWRIEGDESGARCTRSKDSPDIELTSSRLASVFLGGTDLGELALAGLVGEQSKGAVKHVARGLNHSPAPWSPFVF